MTRRLDIAPRLNEGGWSFIQVRVLLLVSVVMLLDGMDTQAFALSLPVMSSSLNIPLSSLGTILALSFISMAIGTLTGGAISDRIGRRPVLLGSVLVFGLATLAASQASGLLTLGMTRLIAAFGMGAAFPSATALVAEYVPRRARSWALSIVVGSVPAGSFVAGMLASYLLPVGGWRSVFEVFGLLSTVSGVVLVLLLPESVRFMVARSVDRRRVARTLKSLGQHVQEGTEVFDSDVVVNVVPVKLLLQSGHLGNIIFLSAAFLMAGLANMAIASWLPALIAKAVGDLQLGSQAVAFYSLGGLVGCFIASIALTRAGSRVAFLGFCTAALVGTLLTANMPFGHGLDPFSTKALLFCLGVLIPGLQVMLYAFAGQVFPIEARATGVGFVSSVGRVGAFCSALIGPTLVQLGQSGFFWTIAAVVVAAGVFLQLVPGQIGRVRSLP